MRRIIKILAYIFGSIVGLLIILYILLQFSGVQTWAAKKAVKAVSEQLGGNIQVEKVKIVFFNKASLRNILIVAKEPPKDTLLHIKELDVTFSLSGLLQDELEITGLSVKGGCFNLKQESEDKTNIDRIFPKDPSKPQKEGGEMLLSLKKLDVSDFTFTLDNPFGRDSSIAPNQIDFKDLCVSKIDVKARGVALTKDSLTVDVKNISGADKSGFKIVLKGKVAVTGKKAAIYQLLLTDGFTKVDAPLLALNYSSPKSLKYFVDSVALDVKLNNSTLNFATIAHVSKGMKTSSLILNNLSGEISGPVRDLRAKSLSASCGSLTGVTLKNLRLSGLPKADEASLTAEVNSITTSGPEIATLLSSLNGADRIKFFDSFPKKDIFKYRGQISGYLNNLRVAGVLSLGDGEAFSEVNIDRRSASNTAIYAKAEANKLPIGEVIGAKNIGAFSGRAAAEVLSGEKGAQITIDSLRISALDFNGYTFSNIFAIGKYAGNFFEGKVVAHDKNLDFIFQGASSTTLKGDTKYKFFANIPYANLAAINLDKRDSVSIISLAANVNLTQKRESGFLGTLRLDSPTYTNSLGAFNLGKIEAKSYLRSGGYVIEILSDFLRARYEGSSQITQFITDVKNEILCRHLSRLFGEAPKEVHKAEEATTKAKRDYKFTLQTFDTQGICALLSPGLYVQKGTSCSFKFSNNQYHLALKSGRIALKSNYLRNININVQTSGDSLIRATLFGKAASVAGMRVDSTRISARGTNNKFDIAVRFHNDSTGENNTNIAARLSLLKDTLLNYMGSERKILSPIALSLKESEIKLKGNSWHIAPSSLLLSDSVNVVNNLKIYNGRQNLSVSGSLSKHWPDSLSIGMEKFDIAILDQFLTTSFDLQGLLSGRANFSLNKGNTKMYASFSGDSMYVYKTPIGKLTLFGGWSAPEKRYNLALETLHNNISKLKILGFYKPDNNFLDLHLALDNFALAYFEPLLSSVVNDISGSLSGVVSLSGQPDKLSLAGEKCRFNDFKFTLGFTKVPYTLNGPFEVGQTGIKLQNCIITDNTSKRGQRGVLSGGVTYKHFKDIKADVNIALSNLLALNTLEKDNESFYGKAYASGNVKIKGTPDKMALIINATTEPGTLVHIPIPHTSTASGVRMLTFVKKEDTNTIDPYDTLFFAKPVQKEPMELDVKLQLNATEQAEVWLEVDKSTGDIIKARGTGQVGIAVNPKRELFNLSGNYVIENGSYHFVLMGIATRDFEVQGGSSVTFNGAIDNTVLDLAAVYKAKASINPLISDTSSVSTMRTVYSSIIAKGKLSNPEIKFKIDVPDLDPATKIKVESALNSDDKIQRQFAALIASGGFVPDAQSGITSNSTMLYSNASEMLSNQINNIFNQLGIPLDLGLNYQPGDNNRNNAYDVAVSTQLWNNRVIINGNIGNNPYAEDDGSDVTGNVDIEFKIDRKGKIRLSAFTHATDKYSNYLDESQRTGIGIAYQHEFNSFKDLWRKKSAKQREYEKMLRERKKALKKRRRKKE